MVSKHGRIELPAIAMGLARCDRAGVMPREAALSGQPRPPSQWGRGVMSLHGGPD